MTGLTAAIPVRSFREGKTRLAGHLSSIERANLIQSMLMSVIEAAREAEIADRVLVVSADEEVLAFAADLDDLVVPVRQSLLAPGLIAAAEIARQRAIACGSERLLILFGDLPSVSAGDLRDLAQESAPVVIATDRVGAGTNGLLLRLDYPETHEFRFVYGPDSCRLHLEEATRLGLEPVAAVIGGLALDLDTAEDFSALLASDRAIPDWLRALPIQPQEISA